MYVLILTILLTGDTMTYGAGTHEAVKFPTKAACEKVRTEQVAELKATPKMPDFKLECVKDK